MVDVIVAPRVEDPLSDVEAVISGGFFQLRSAYWNATAGQWISDAWSAPITLNGAAVTVKLDASTVPYEMYMEYPDGQNENIVRRESRIVTASASPLKWELLELVAGEGAPPALPSDLANRVTNLETTVAGIGSTGTATNLAGITNMSPLARTLNVQTAQSGMLTTIGAASSAAVDAVALTANAALPANTLGTGNGPAKLSADGQSVLKADGTPFTGGTTIGQTVGTALDAGRYSGDIQDIPIVIHEGDPRYTNHPVTQRSVHFYGATDPGNTGSRTLGGGGLAPRGTTSTGVPIIDKWFQVVP